MYAKYEVSISYGSKVLAKFNVKVDNKQQSRQDKNNMRTIIQSGGIKWTCEPSLFQHTKNTKQEAQLGLISGTWAIVPLQNV